MKNVTRDSLIATVRRSVGAPIPAERTGEMDSLVDGFLGPTGWKYIVSAFPSGAELRQDAEAMNDTAAHAAALVKSYSRLTKRARNELKREAVASKLGIVPGYVAALAELLKKTGSKWRERRKRHGHRAPDMPGAYLTNLAVELFEALTGKAVTNGNARKLVEALFGLVGHSDAGSARNHLRQAVSERKAVRELTYEERRARRKHLNRRRRGKNLAA
jgi:hypothetical protein